MQAQLAKRPGGILFVGGAPSEEDALKGYPFVGSDGFILSRALRAANMVEPSVANLPRDFEPHLRGETRRLLWERRAHSFTTVFGSPVKDIEKLKEIPAELAEQLAATVAAVKPNLIVPLGATALLAFTGETTIEAYRGAVGSATLVAPGIKMLPSYAPGVINQRYKFLTVLIGDFLKAKAEAKFPEIRPQEIELWLQPTLEDLDVFYTRHIAGADLLSVDIETGGGQISCVGIGTSPTVGIVLPFVDYGQANRSYWADAGSELKAWRWLAKVLDTPTPKLMQNGGAFDVFWFLDRAGLPVRNYRHDLRLVHHVLFPELPKSLAFMGATYTNLPSWKAGVRHDESKRDS